MGDSLPSSPHTATRGKDRKPLTEEQRNQAAADRALIQRVAGGDDSAFSSFYRRFAPALFSMIYAVLHDQKESEDVLQESFLQMWNKAASYDGERSTVFTWAVMISRNRAIDRIRARQRRLRVVEAATAEAAAAPIELGEQADEMLGRGEDNQRVRQALSTLPEAQRHAIDLAFFRGLTQAEISAQLKTPLGTIKARIRRGLIALRDVLEPAT